MIVLFAPAGIGEVQPGDDLAAAIVAAVDADPSGPLRDGDVLVVTSKILSKAEGRQRPATEREAAIDAESLSTVARRGPTRIVRTRQGLTLAAAGVDNSNVAAGTILLLPVDPDGSAARLRHRLESLTGARLGVVVSDTAGRAWRIGQTDQAIGASGVRVVERYAGRTDAYGNLLEVTAVAVADELASAADLVKTKLSGCPVAVVRGVADLLEDDDEPAAGHEDGHGDAHGNTAEAATPAGRSATVPTGPVTHETRARSLVREPAEDMFRYGSREAVVAAVLAATGQGERYEELLGSPSHAVLVDRVLAGSGRTGGEAALLRQVLEAAG